MKKYLFVICSAIGGLFVIFLSLQVSAEVKFKDVPEDHWASKAVYDVVKLGLTQGYPDRTFRGGKNITRYETAIFISKLAEKLGASNLAQMKLDLSEVKGEIIKMREEKIALVSGECEIIGRMANVLTTTGNILGRGPLISYRLKTKFERNLGYGAAFYINIDTMDSGFYGATRELVSQMVDVEGVLKLNPVDIGLADAGFSRPIDVNLMVGPGPVQHADASGLLSSENGMVYDRPYSGFKVGTEILGTNVSQSYFQVAKTIAGRSTSSLLKTELSRSFGWMTLMISGDYYFKFSPSAIRDFRTKISLESMLYSPKIRVKGVLGIGGRESNELLAASEINFIDSWAEGSRLKLYITKVGGEYITPSFSAEQFNSAGYDLFMRPLENATGSFGGEIQHPFSEKLSFSGIINMRFASDFGYGKNKSKSRATGQVGVSYKAAPRADFNAYYRIEQDPTVPETTDFTAAGFTYHF